MKLPRTVEELDELLNSSFTGPDSGEFDGESLLLSSNFPIEDVARAQVLNTIIRAKKPGGCRISVVDRGEFLGAIGTSPVGLMLIACAREWFPKEELSRLRSIRSDYFEQLESWPDLARGDSTFILCDDGFSKGLPYPLFDSEGILRGDDYFQKFVPMLVESVMQSETLKGEFLAQSSLLTTLLYELIKNTQDHALFNAYEEGIEESVRLVQSRFYKLEELEPPEPDIPDVPLEPHIAFVRSLKSTAAGMRNKSKKQFRGILEFSVLDSGPGFVGSMLRREIGEHEDISIEYEAVLACLRKGHSTARNPNRGLGLSDVLRALRKLNGFIRIRTNRISVYRDFNLLRDDRKEVNEAYLHDWRRGFSSKASTFSKVTGAAVTVLVPVEV